MDFNDIEQIRKAGFKGFKKIEELFNDNSSIPKIKGVYLILNTNGKSDFLPVGTGGFFKGRNPNISITELKSNWVDKTIVVYIGKAGKEGGDATLQSRLKQYFSFGQGKNVGHYGGRLIWQLKNSKDLLVCWKELPNEDPRIHEINLIRQFFLNYSKRPFANLTN